MDDQINQGLGGPGLVPPPPGGMPVSPGLGGPPPPPPPPMGGPVPGGDPHEKILASLARIEEKLAAISAKVGV
ncbi:MAG: hypothetical protein ABH816_03945 [Candidatus Levyibacteriota bacterium]